MPLTTLAVQSCTTRPRPDQYVNSFILMRRAFHGLTIDCVQKPPSRRSIPGAGFFSTLFSLLKWVFFIVLIVVGVMAYRGRKASRNAKRF